MKTVRTYTERNLGALVRHTRLDPELAREAELVSRVFPFRVSAHVVDELIDWSDPATDPIYRLTFPQRGMLSEDQIAALERGVGQGESATDGVADEIRAGLNPHPAGQLDCNMAELDGQILEGVQHKYPDTLLLFPAEGQTCHAFCTYCFRWAQFVPGQFRFATRDVGRVADYVRQDERIKDVLITGGDPLVMRASVLARYLEPFLAPDMEHLRIRIGSKALAYHPERFLGDRDADDLLALLGRVVAGGRHVSVMAHFSHPRELHPAATQRAMARLRDVGVTIRCQAPLIRGVNDSAADWAEMWTRQVELGAIPYYMFVERDTGARHFFEVPLARALSIYDEAQSRVSGLARTARGPVMSTTAGKVLVSGVASVDGGDAFVLKLVRARDPRDTNRVELAGFDPAATWLDDLQSLDDPGRRPFAALI